MRSNTLFTKIWSLAFVLLVFLTLTGCTSSRSEVTLSLEASTDPSKEQTPLFTFGIIYPMAHSFYEEITRLAEEAAHPYSIKLIVKAPEGINSEQQIHMMETMINQKVDGIAIDPIDASALLPVINKAIQAGIPVICFESDSPDSQRLSFIGTDNFEAGTRMGDVIKQLQKNKGMILIQSGIKEMKIHEERLNGLLQYLNHNTNIQVLEIQYNEGSSDKALSDMEGMIDRHPHFDTLVSVDLISSSTSVLVWKAKGLNRYAVSFNMTPEMNEAIHNGQITSVISQNEQNWGHLLIDNLLKAAKKEAIPSFIDTGIIEIKN
ncbi:sugar ABC transporter substrate-binding protein [Paenibacillus segetis]|uniref:Periplasmic binding protein domain-containing protein n=1 Tax=Paenibacillus segetis TaxID=1325360 RepID=A0ABQ1Y5I9_9BACL|nr:substrate-binding domain-containing protein [Paenibacillus segetis]GGH12187.1 hypothetical protein GCM10008013_04480 [Paenibacillus segetis]